MKPVNLSEAKTHLSSLVDEAKAGAEIIIAKNGKPAARLVPMGPAAEPAKPRRFGFWAHYKDWNPPDVFPETTQEEIELWENGPIFPDDEKKEPE
jgi:prevent-host-death family protein